MSVTLYIFATKRYILQLQCTASQTDRQTVRQRTVSSVLWPIVQLTI